MDILHGDTETYIAILKKDKFFKIIFLSDVKFHNLWPSNPWIRIRIRIETNADHNTGKNPVECRLCKAVQPSSTLVHNRARNVVRHSFQFGFSVAQGDIFL
jgi:hypothetical protein